MLLTNACGANHSNGDAAALGCETGTEGCTCYRNWSCNYQLSCLDDVCIDRRKVAAEESKELAKSSLRAIDPIVAVTNETCMSCIETDCVSPLSECYESDGCAVLFGCLLPCVSRPGASYAACAETCYAEAPLSAHPHATQLQVCAQAHCGEGCGG